ncbi:hypothetical protein I4U23_005905 [Adineta vaga]|nr:hypothetical protein I4U23_005905 [Adineta vaga]
MKNYLYFIIYLLFNQSILISSLFYTKEKQLILLPSVAFRYHSNVTTLIDNIHPSNDWILYTQGWYFEENRFRAKLARTALSTVVNDVNKKRVAYFTGSGKKYESLCLNGLSLDLCVKTDAYGLLKKQFHLSNNDVQRFRISDGHVEYFISTINRDIRTKGEIFLCDDNGISIISDIDDTIKITGVTSVRSILRNTFSGKYQSIPGMSERYRHYKLIYNATFHYLTASPDQLYPFLREFLDYEQFPLGSYHMRHFSWFDINFFKFFQSKSFIKQKTHILHMFFTQTHSRKYILFGDIFQKDPEIYANIYQQYPERILHIFIRVSQLNLSNRLKQVFQHIPKTKWNIFVNGYDLPLNISCQLYSHK